MSTAVLVYAVASIATALVDVLIGCLALTKSRRDRGFYLALFAFDAAFVDLAYLASMLSDSPEAASFFSSLYFCGVDLLLLFVILHFFDLTKAKRSQLARIALRIIAVIAAIDMVSLLLNPVTGAVIDYVSQDSLLVPWVYEPHMPYKLHLVFTYLLVIAGCVLLIRAARRSPRVYRNRYLAPLVVLIVLVLANAAFLLLPGALPDFSILFYSVAIVLLFWISFSYSPKKMLDEIRSMVINDMGQAVVIFDYERCYASSNADADAFLPSDKRTKSYRLQDFVRDLAIARFMGDSLDEDSRFLLYAQRDGNPVAYQCSYRVVRDDRSRNVAYLFIFSANSLETDAVTGFQTMTSFSRLASEGGAVFDLPVSVVACDLNRLNELNERCGRAVGDRALRDMALIMRRRFPSGSVFVRTNEAALLAMIPASLKVDIKAAIKETQQDLAEHDYGIGPTTMSSAACATAADEPDVLRAMATAIGGMRSGKMLNRASAHTSLMDSLVQMQRESDGETEDHVARTRVMGEMLGGRLGLTDAQQSSLALLCLLHDVGKVGVPLEILNKPTKLSESEWEVMKSHVFRGYRIAKASPELESLADPILHHHECWDGSGYPDGLKHEKIPLLSRIISVVDSYDAMTNDRPYRNALSPEMARAELRRCAGSQFDPAIVEEFQRLLDQLGIPDEPTEQDVSGEDVRKTGARRPLSMAAPPVSPPVSFESRTNALLGEVRYSRYIVNVDNRIVQVDGRFEELTGYSAKDVAKLGLGQGDLIFSEEREEYFARVGALLDQNREVYFEHRLRRKDGSECFVLCFGKLFFDSVAREMRSEILIADIAETATMRRVLETGHLRVDDVDCPAAGARE